MKIISTVMFTAASLLLAYSFIAEVAIRRTGSAILDGNPPPGYLLAVALYAGAAAAAIIWRQPTPSR